MLGGSNYSNNGSNAISQPAVAYQPVGPNTQTKLVTSTIIGQTAAEVSRPDERSVFEQQTGDEESNCASCCNKLCVFLGWALTWCCPCIWCRYIKDYERVIVFRNGKIQGKQGKEPQGPGLVLLNPFADEASVVDLRVVTINLVPQSMMTKDSVTVSVDGIVYIQVFDPLKSVTEVEDHKMATLMLAATTLRGVVGSHTLEQLLGEREKINKAIKRILVKETNKWGVKVDNVEVKDVILPVSMQRAMASEAETERERRAKKINSLGEVEAAENLAKAARTISAAPGAMQLRYLQSLKTISVEKNSTILFPFPMDVMEGVKTLASAVKQQNGKSYSQLPTSTQGPYVDLTSNRYNYPVHNNPIQYGNQVHYPEMKL